MAGDRHDIEVTLEPGAKAMVMGQAAEKVYRSNGLDCRIDVDLRVGDSAWLEWLPQETILFDNARLRRTNRAKVANGARMLAGDILVFGRTARGENLRQGLVHDAWEISGPDGRPDWKDVLHMEGDLGRHPRPSRLLRRGAGLMAALMFAAPDAERASEMARAMAARPREFVAAHRRPPASTTCCWRAFWAATPWNLRDAFAALWCGLAARRRARCRP